jgi:HTH-type transcriptional regulator/antitoxin HigA
MRNTIGGVAKEATSKMRVIKTPKQHEVALEELERLIRLDPDPGTPDADRAELLVLLVEAYEASQHRIPRPDPLSAIRFRMDQLGLTQRDLVPYMGSRSKVSEVLAGKRPLTLSMIRALHKGLDIPADVLLQDPDAELPEDHGLVWSRFPLREMAKRGWISVNDDSDLRDRAEELMRGFLDPLENVGLLSVLYRQTVSARSLRRMDRYALVVWTARVLIRALREGSDAPYSNEALTADFMREICQLSWSSHGPLLARELLAKHGVTVLVEPHLPRTHLDGAAMIGREGRPIIALTLRHDRTDSFWFCLMHELAHVMLHLRESGTAFVDDLDGSSNDTREQQADEAASEAIIPSSDWGRSQARQDRRPTSIRRLADSLRISPALVAGRIRYETGNYRILSQLVGYGQVRKLFEEFA